VDSARLCHLLVVSKVRSTNLVCRCRAKGKNLKASSRFTWTPGPDCLICATFAQQRYALNQELYWTRQGVFWTRWNLFLNPAVCNTVGSCGGSYG
jgi:hypothetical protein